MHTFLEYKLALAIFNSQILKDVLSMEIPKDKKVPGEIFNFEYLKIRIPYEDEDTEENILYYNLSYFNYNIFFKSKGYKISYKEHQKFLITKNEYEEISEELDKLILKLFKDNQIKLIDDLVKTVFYIVENKLNKEIIIRDDSSFSDFFEIVSLEEFYVKDFLFKFSKEDYFNARAYTKDLFGFLGYLHCQYNSDEIKEYIEDENTPDALSMRYMTIDENLGHDDYKNHRKAIKYLELGDKKYFIYPWGEKDTEEDKIKCVYHILLNIYNDGHMKELISFNSSYVYFIGYVKELKLKYYEYDLEK